MTDDSLTHGISQTNSIDPTDGINRRTVLQALGVTAGGLAATGAASAHEFGSGSSDSTSSSDGHDHTDPSQHADSAHAELLDYHSLGGVGPSSNAGRPDDPHYGAATELRVHGDYAYVGFFSSKSPTNDRGMAVLDVHEFNDAETYEDLRDAELSVVSFLRNQNSASAVMDLKVSDDGDYVFLSKQPYTALYDDVDPKPSTDGESVDASAGSVVAVDVSEPANPAVVGAYEGWTTGSHNACYHRIDGTEYLFAIHDTGDGTAGLYVLEFDRTTGQFAVVNRWTTGGATSGTTYIHDITVQDDPKTGTPTGYLSYWNEGVYALDLSDPTSVSVVGHFDMQRGHYAEPAPDLIDGKRVLVTGQETPSQTDGSSGTIHLVDADPIYEDETETPELAELDVWEWRPNVSFSNFTLSPHNFDVTAEGWVHLGHYHGGVRFLRIETTGWSLTERGFYRPHKDVPEASKMEGLNSAVPFTWTAVEQNGVTFLSDINTGVYAVHNEYVPFGDDPGAGAYVSVDRQDDGDAFTGGQTNRVDLAVGADRPVLVRDRIPAEWSVVEGDAHRTHTAGGRTYVEFEMPVEAGERTYFAEAPTGAEQTGDYAFGPVEYSADGGETWTEVAGTTETNAVLGTSTATVGVAGAATALGTAAYHFRDGLGKFVGGETTDGASEDDGDALGGGEEPSGSEAETSGGDGE